jgi:hypothetical protein
MCTTATSQLQHLKEYPSDDHWLVKLSLQIVGLLIGWLIMFLIGWLE